jgi:thioredoxin
MEPNEFNAKLKANPRPVIVDLWAPWCAPCRVMEPTLKKVAQTYEGQVDVWKLNADDSPEMVRALKVMGIPTTIGFANGEEVIRKTGVQTLESLDILFDATLHQRGTVILPPAPIDRWIRSILGIALMLWGWSMEQSLVILAIGGIVLFSAFYDRCPIFRAVAPRLIGHFRKIPKPVQKEKPSL